MFDNVLSHRRHIGKVLFPDNGIQPYFKYSILYCLHFFFGSLILLSVKKGHKFKIQENKRNYFFAKNHYLLIFCFILKMRFYLCSNLQRYIDRWLWSARLPPRNICHYCYFMYLSIIFYSGHKNCYQFILTFIIMKMGYNYFTLY